MRRLRIILLGVLLVLAGCGFDPTDIPIRGTYVEGEKYSIRIEFASVLNLPAKAKVVADGIDVGVLTDVALHGDLAIATVDLKAGVRLPKSTTAELRQSTILGDIFVALQPPRGSGGPYLAGGDTIPVGQTLPATNVEALVRGLSTVVTGGTITDVAELVNKVNAAFPEDPAEIERITRAGRLALDDLAANTADLDRILAAAAEVSITLESRKNDVDRVLTEGPARIAGLGELVFSVVALILTIKPFAVQLGTLLFPVEEDVRGIISVITPSLLTIANADTSVPANLDAFRKLLRDKLVPFFSAPPNIRVVDGGSPEARADELVTVLRSIGLVP
ncbi:MlaD family protein [Nocardia sp. XZ_19_385]|uniref:MlaD family protein n=1 Tax=Nocardia sp. XZ_19_385 TaxID=2769488 RepID=UPI0018906B41|nr:MlaD family protein [Nocardia sp. XZ_19_385]